MGRQWSGTVGWLSTWLCDGMCALVVVGKDLVGANGEDTYLRGVARGMRGYTCPRLKGQRGVAKGLERRQGVSFPLLLCACHLLPIFSRLYHCLQLADWAVKRLE